MDPDTALVIGLVVAALAIPSVIGAFSRGDPPRVAMICLVVGGALVAFAAAQKPGGYSGAEIPGIFQSVVMDIIQ